MKILVCEPHKHPYVKDIPHELHEMQEVVGGLIQALYFEDNDRVAAICNSPTLGNVFFGDKDISKYTNDQLAVFRRENCGFVFQSIYLLENMTVFDNILTVALVLQKNSH